MCNLKQHDSSETATDVIVEINLFPVDFFNCQLLILHWYLRSESAIWVHRFIKKFWH